MNAACDNFTDNQWLLKYVENVCSRSGEDGILQEIFEV